jgi:periplasmic protein TonB
MLQVTPENQDRIKSAVGVALFHALLGYALITGLGFDPIRVATQELKMFDVALELPPPLAEPPPPQPEPSDNNKTKEREGAASPANLRDTPTQIVVPQPKIRLPLPTPIVAAPAAGQGHAPAAGAANIRGPGTGSGGVGTGLGSGDHGTGTGGGGGGRGTRARQIRGSIRDSDWPLGAIAARAEGTVFLRFVVAPTGRVSDCRVTRSSGRADLDATTCRLIRQRFVYRPARDIGGRPIAEVIEGEHVWEMGEPVYGPMIEEEEGPEH